MDQIEKELKSSLLELLDKDETNFVKIVNSFNIACNSLNLKNREDVGFYSVIAESFGFGFSISLYYQLTKNEGGEKTDTSAKYTIDFSCENEEDFKILDARLYETKVIEVDLNIDQAFKEIREMEIFKNLTSREVFYS